MPLSLFGRLRRWKTNILAAAICGLVLLLAGPVHYSLNPDGGYLIAIAAQLPLIPAVIMQSSSMTPLGIQESHASRSMGRWRAANYVLLSLAVAVVLGAAALTYSPLAGTTHTGGFFLGPFVVIRNLAAFTGAAFVGASILGPSLGWVVPAAWAILPYVFLTQTSSQHEVLALVIQPGDSFTAFITAAGIWAVGLLITAGNARGPFDVGQAGISISRARHSSYRGRRRTKTHAAAPTLTNVSDDSSR